MTFACLLSGSNVPVWLALKDMNKFKNSQRYEGQEKKLWFISFGKLQGTALEKHIVLDATLFSRINNK